jgi:hypothetical protein
MKLKKRRYITNELNINSPDLHLLFLERGIQIYPRTKDQQFSYMIKYGSVENNVGIDNIYIHTAQQYKDRLLSPLHSSLI